MPDENHRNCIRRIDRGDGAATRDVDVEVIEKGDAMLEKGSCFEKQGDRFEVGPSLLAMPIVVDESPSLAGRSSAGSTDSVR